MSRFRQADDHTIPYSELKPERFDPARLLDPVEDKAKLDEMRRLFMEEIPLPEEIEADRPRQLRGNK